MRLQSFSFRAVKQKMRDSLPVRLLFTAIFLIVAAILTANGHHGAGMLADIPLMVPLQKSANNEDKSTVLEKFSKPETFANILQLTGDAISFRKHENGGEFIRFHKDVSGAIRTARIAAGASEQQAADALGVDLNDYVDFEENGGELDITGANMKSLAKAFKMPIEELAAQLIATPKPVAPGMDGEGNPTSGSQDDPPGANPPDALGKSRLRKEREKEIALEKSKLPSTQIRSIGVGGIGDGTYTNDDLLDVAIPLEKRKQEAQRRFFKSLLTGPDAPKTESEYQKFRKSGLITADMFGPTPAIDPVLANTIINLFIGEDQYLKQIQTKIMTGKKQNVNVMDIPFRSATRLTPNVWPSSATGSNPINRSLQFDAQAIDFTWVVPDDTLMAYRGLLPQLEAEITGGFVKALSTDIWDLGLNGTTDVYDGSTFTTLNQGWIDMLLNGSTTDKEVDTACPAGQILSIGGLSLTSVDAVMDAMFAAAMNPTNGNQRFFSNTTPVLISSYNFDQYEQQMKASHPTFLIPQDGMPETYRKRPLNQTNKFQDETTYLHTEMSNLVVGIVAGMPGAGGDGISIERFRVPKATRLIATVYLDFGVANSKAAVVTTA